MTIIQIYTIQIQIVLSYYKLHINFVSLKINSIKSLTWINGLKF